MFLTRLGKHSAVILTACVRLEWAHPNGEEGISVGRGASVRGVANLRAALVCAAADTLGLGFAAGDDNVVSSLDTVDVVVSDAAVARETRVEGSCPRCEDVA